MGQAGAWVVCAGGLRGWASGWSEIEMQASRASGYVGMGPTGSVVGREGRDGKVGRQVGRRRLAGGTGHGADCLEGQSRAACRDMCRCHGEAWLANRGSRRACEL